MRKLIPSFRIQILILVLFLMVNAVLFFRNYFLDNLTSFNAGIDALEIESKIAQLHKTYASQLPSDQQAAFREDVEALLETEHQVRLARELFRKDIELYSYFIFIFLTAAALGLFFLSFNLISRPLKRLQEAAGELARGNWTIQVRENRFSPLNDLIVSFNQMVTELEESRRKLVQVEKEMAWRDMARVMAHEIKNPLTPIRLSLDRLEAKVHAGSDQIQEVLEAVVRVIREEVTNLQTLAGEFSQFARLPEAQLRPLKLGPFLEDILQPYRECGVTLALEPGPDAIMGDRVQLKQVVVNLVQNALQASGESPEIQVGVTSGKEEIVLWVSDRGKGIEPDQLEKIFEPYYTRREKGTGLGLAIVKRIVENHGGTIHVTSQTGKGTRFELRFPTTDMSAEGKAP
ncbi:MAG: HAMP domain-containing protein [Candidatus Neomarinimicrobiota bacterium]|nr:MAG: HAMP domain-containing protein [Candidatus Neomarinimicrobiota bacterium]